MTLQATEPARRPRTTTLVDRLAGVLDRSTSRRGFLARTAVVGSALAVGPVQFVLRPGTAYANVCGTDSSCSSGYTVFCATINNGVNRCPPGALVGGWWKADSSGYCCGNARYYIDCHSYCSCGCGGGSRFCGEGCRNCSCGCGPSSSCDQRRVCCNNFRYGQCMQHVSCTGPVWCRVVTCTPPWRVPQWSCTSTPATDNRTGAHTSPALAGCTPIVGKYSELGGPGGRLGEAVTGERTLADGRGRVTHYDGGSIFWHPDTGAHTVHGAIQDLWAATGWERGRLGYPATDETGTADGRGCYNHFSGGGSIFWSPQTGAHAVYAGIRQKWADLGWERGRLGYPTSSETSRDDRGCSNTFEGGTVAWSPTTGTHAVHGGILGLWQASGGERGRLGYPVTDETSRDGRGCANLFEGGAVYWSPQTGTHDVYGAIRDRFDALGSETGRLGYPTTGETSPEGLGCYNDFEGGTIAWSPTTGAHSVSGAVRSRWAALGRETGRLGYPVTDETPTAGGGSFNDFVGAGSAVAPAASVYWSAATGAWAVEGRIRAHWLERGGPTSRFGLPVAEARPTGPGRTRQDFQGGWIETDATGAVTEG